MSKAQESYRKILRDIEENGCFYCVDSFSIEYDQPVLKCVKSDTSPPNLEGRFLHNILLYTIDNTGNIFVERAPIEIDEIFRFATDDEIKSFEAQLIMTEMK